MKVYIVVDKGAEPKECIISVHTTKEGAEAVARISKDMNPLDNFGIVSENVEE